MAGGQVAQGAEDAGDGAAAGRQDGGGREDVDAGGGGTDELGREEREERGGLAGRSMASILGGRSG